MARPSKLTKELLEKAREYVVSCVDNVERDEKGRVVEIEVNFPTGEGLANHIGVTRTTIYDWADKKSPRYNKEFSDILEAINQEQVKRLINRGLSGHYSPMIAKLVLAKHGYKDRSDHTTDDKPLTINISKEIADKNDINT